MKILIIMFFVMNFLWLGTIEISGDQSGSWNSADNPFELVGDVTVPEGEILQIEAGVEIIAMGNYKITILGNIIAAGTEQDTIRFHGSDGLNWGGLRFENESVQSELYYCRISNTDDTNDYGIHSINSPILVHNCLIDDHQKGISFSGLSTGNPSYMEIKFSRISNVTKSGITVLDNSNVLIDSCEVTQCGLGAQFYGAIQLSLQTSDHNCSPVISNNHIHHNSKQGITMANLFDYDGMFPTISGNLVEFNLTGMYFYSAQGMVDNNIIRDNFIAGDANSGAGVMMYGSSADGFFTNNEISGNFTGFYLTVGATANLGNVYNGSDLDDGYNYIHDNVDESGNVYSIYNDSSADVHAQNNLWDSADPEEIAETIIDVYDSMTSGEVIFEPLYYYTTPPAPENLNAADFGSQIQLTWDYEDILGFSHFNVYWSVNESGFDLLDSCNETEFLTDIISEDDYFEFYVTAVNVLEIESESSEVIWFSWVDSEEEEILSNKSGISIYPNPFNPSTTISFITTENSENTEIVIYNLKGQQVKKYSIFNIQSSITNDQYSVSWDGTDYHGTPVGSGVYFVRLEIDGRVLQKKMVLIK
jgi:parallel beta helix pectate lyase-like protein/type IX secretion system substrate protein